MSLNLYLWNDGWNTTRRTYYIILVRSGFCILSRKTSLVSCLNNVPVPYSDEGYRSGGWWDEFVQHSSAQEEGGGVMYLIL